MLIAGPAGKALARRLGMASRPIEKQPSAIAQHELGLPGQRLDILADLQTDADRRAVEEGLAKKAAERHRAAIIGRAAETLARSEEHTSELQSLMRISYAVFCLKKKNKPHIEN